MSNLDEKIDAINAAEDAAGDEWTLLERMCKSAALAVGEVACLSLSASTILQLIAEARKVVTLRDHIEILTRK